MEMIKKLDKELPSIRSVALFVCFYRDEVRGIALFCVHVNDAAVACATWRCGYFFCFVLLLIHFASLFPVVLLWVDLLCFASFCFVFLLFVCFSFALVLFFALFPILTCVHAQPPSPRCPPTCSRRALE